MHKDVTAAVNISHLPKRVAVVVGKFNEEITDGLSEGAYRALFEAGLTKEAIDTYSVAGSFEVAEMASHLSKTGRYGALICLGAIIKGETTHDEHLARAVITSILNSATAASIPIGLGIITTRDEAQAKARSAADEYNRGYHAGKAALELFVQMYPL